MEENPKFCLQCGAQLQVDERFCHACGCPVAQVDAANGINDQMGYQQGMAMPGAGMQGMPGAGMQGMPGVPMQGMPGVPMQGVPNSYAQDGSVQGSNDAVFKDSKRGKGKKIGIIAGISVALVAVIVVVGVLLFSGKTRLSRTLMVYMIGSNLESEDAAGSLDIKEMLGANFDPETTNVLVYTGGSRKWALREIDPNENAVFEIKDGELEKVNTYEKKVMTHPEVLTEFIDYAYNNYESDLYDLVLWDHGGGPIMGFGLDENSLSAVPMSISQLSSALSETNLIKDGKKLDLIGFDACLMGSVEVAQALSDYGNYMVASEEIEPGKGWDYGFLNALSKESEDVSTVALGHQIVDSFFSHYDDYNYNVDLSLALVDLGKVNELSAAVDGLFSTVKGEVSATTFSDYSRTMTRSKVYGYLGNSNTSFDLVDLLDLCNSLKDSHAESVVAIKRNLDEAVLYSRSNIENTNGLSIYFVNYNKENAEKMVESYRDVAVSDNYYNFLNGYAKLVNGRSMVPKTVYNDLAEKRDGSNISIELSDELRDNYQSGEIIIFRKLDDNKFMPVYRSSEVALNGNQLSATTLDLQFVIEASLHDGTTEYGWATMAEKERTDEYTDYVTFGILYYETDENSIGVGIKNYDMYIRLPKGSKEAVVKDIRVKSDNDLSSKMSFDSEKITEIDFLNGAYKLYNDNGVLDYNMATHGTNYGIGVNMRAGDTYKIKLVGLDYDFGDIFSGQFKNTKDYYAEFVVHDTQGKTHSLNLVHI